MTAVEVEPGRASRRGRGVVVVNRRSGRQHAAIQQLPKLFSDHDVIECEPNELSSVIRRTLTDETAFVGVAGGDGSMRTAAQHLVGSAVPLLPIPAGTRNHFARQLGVIDFQAAAEAVSGAIEAVDVGEVNGRNPSNYRDPKSSRDPINYFVNNSTIGLYPEMVELRQRYQDRGLPKRLAQIVAASYQAVHGHRFDVNVDGVPCRAWMVFVGNGRYGEDVFDITERSSITQHVLDVRVVRADSFLARTRVTVSLVFGRLHRSPLLVTRMCSEVDVYLGERPVEVAFDGEVQVVASPLHYRSRPSALRVLIPVGGRHRRPRILGRLRPRP
jgi:undecaprenyl-diphosphatase